MKRFITLSLVLLTIMGIGNYSYAQEFGAESTMTRQEARRAARAAHRKAEAAQQLKDFQAAVECIKSGSFVIEADQLLFPRGLSKFVSGLTNFISMNDGNHILRQV